MESKNVEIAWKNVETAYRELEEAMKERADILWQEIQERVKEWGRVGVPIVRDAFPDTTYNTEESILQLLGGFIRAWLEDLSPNVAELILKQLPDNLESEDEDEDEDL